VPIPVPHALSSIAGRKTPPASSNTGTGTALQAETSLSQVAEGEGSLFWRLLSFFLRLSHFGNRGTFDREKTVNREGRALVGAPRLDSSGDSLSVD